MAKYKVGDCIQDYIDGWIGIIHGYNNKEQGYFVEWLNHYSLMNAEGYIERCKFIGNNTELVRILYGK